MPRTCHFHSIKNSFPVSRQVRVFIAQLKDNSMPWLRAGTVAVTNGSTTVTGTNADFAANARTGDSFVGPDGLNYEVANVASATVISILPAYKGPTASGAAYAIMPVQGYDKMLSDAFNNLNNQFGLKLAALGTTGNYDVLPVTKGGTGGTTQATAQAGLGLGTAATGTITTSTTDYTSGRVVRMGDAGVGAMMSPPWPNTSLNNCSGVPQGRYSTTGSTTDLPPGAAVGTVDFGIRNAGAFEYTMTHLSRAGNVLNMRTAAGGSSSSPGWTSWETLVKGGANSTITSLSGLTTALSVAQGGTGLGAQIFTNLTLDNSWTVIPSRRAAIRKIMDNIQLELQIVGGTATDGTVLTTLPVGSRPPFTITVPVQSAPNTALSTTVGVPGIAINAGGTVTCNNCTSLAGIKVTVIFATV